MKGYRAYQKTKSKAGIDFTNCDKGYCKNCDINTQHDCQWEADSLHYPDFHKQAVNEFLSYLVTGGK